MLLYFKISFEHISKCQKNQQTMSHVHIKILYARKVVSQEKDIVCVVCKKIKFNAKKQLLFRYFFIFFNMTQKISVSLKIDVHA
jgi:hypothetical protein